LERELTKLEAAEKEIVIDSKKVAQQDSASKNTPKIIFMVVISIILVILAWMFDVFENKDISMNDEINITTDTDKES